MTRKLEELFNLSRDDDDDDISLPDVKLSEDDVNSMTQQYMNSLPTIRELSNLDEHELERLAAKAEDSYNMLMDLGMNVEMRYTARIMEIASSMMRNAIDARSIKVDKRLKAVELQLKKLKIDEGIRTSGVINGEGYVVADRNEILKQLGR